MGKPSKPQLVKLIASLIAREDDIMEAVIGELAVQFGRIDFSSERFPFDKTSYYEAEMGKNLWRRFTSFEKLITPASLPSIKFKTNKIEERYSREDGGRRINIDPGYISLGKLVLATTKEGPHRPYLAKGIYADLTLIYKEKGFRPLEWTYPDYASKEVVELMNNLRERYRLQRKEGLS